MRVLALTKYDTLAASTRQRFLLYAPWLAANGVELTVAPLTDNAYVASIGSGRRSSRLALARAYARRIWQLLRARDYDLLWISYELFPFLPGVFERLARLTGIPYVVDYDDATFHVYDASPNPLVRALLGRKLEPLLRSAAAVVAGNAYVAEYARRFCRDTVIIPTVVDTDLCRPAPRRDAPAAPAAPVIGWLGSPTTWQNVEPLLPTILEVARRHGAEFHATGAGRGARDIAGVVSHEWTEASEVERLQAMTIGVMPLLDLPFMRGKCGYKLIQYMACGVPVVASPVGVNREIVSSSDSGFLATTPAEWAQALETLLADAALRREMGDSGRRAAVERYSLASQRGPLLDVLRRAAKAGTPAM